MIAAALRPLVLALPFLTLAASHHDFTIRAGAHHAKSGGPRSLQIGWHVDRTVKFRAVFHGDVPYLTQLASNQADWNKLMGLTTNRIHHASIRLGWRWRPDLKKVELGFYGYLSGQRVMLPLQTVALETPIDIELRFWNGGASARAGGAYHEEARSLGLSHWLPAMTWLLETAYFGGDETAPHDMDISVSDINQ
jgi:hypothetical protein